MSTNGYSLAGMRHGAAAAEILAPIAISSPTRAVRIGDYGPCLVLNTHLSATVWVNRDANVRDGLGIPVPPGQSVPWLGGEIWAILGLDTSSAGQTVALIVSTYVRDWQNLVAIAIATLNSGLLLIDQPVQLATAAITANGLTQLGDFAVSTYQTLLLKTAKSAPAHTVLLDFLWKLVPGPAAAIIARDEYQWSTADTAGMENVVVPCRGAYVEIRYSSGAAGINDSITVYASHRPKTSYDTIGDGTRLIAQGFNATLLTGATLTATPLSRYDGPAMFSTYMTGGAAAIPGEVRLSDTVTGNFVPIVWDPGLVAGGIGRFFSHRNVVIPRNSWSAAVTNLSAGTVQAAIEIVAAPEST